MFIKITKYKDCKKILFNPNKAGLVEGSFSC